MIRYALKNNIKSTDAVKKLKQFVKHDKIIQIGCTEKNEPYVETDWHVYLVKLKGDYYKLPVMWSKSKKPYLVSGILTVLLCLFFVGGHITDVMMLVIFTGLVLVNVLKRKEINAIKQAIEEALNQ